MESLTSLTGLGLQGTVDGEGILVGRSALVPERGIGLPSELARALAEQEARGATAVVSACDGRTEAVFAVADTPSRCQARRPPDSGARTRPGPADRRHPPHREAVAAGVGIERTVAEVLPPEKAAVVARRQAEGHAVAMGRQRRAGARQADPRERGRTGTDVASEASEPTLVSGDLHAAADATELSRRTLRTIRASRSGRSPTTPR